MARFLKAGKLVESHSLVLLAAAKHSLLLPRKDSGHLARWFLTKEKFGSVRISAHKFKAQLRSSGDGTQF